MTYQEIDQLMLNRGLFTDPAFGDELAIAIEPTPNLDGCPLGLYYPDTPTIILPPDATQGALFHELGHRHGHFYYDNLSERYAEDFRRKYQRGRALLYKGNHFAMLPKFGALFEEGERGMVEVALLQALTPDELYEVKSQLYSYGEIPPKIYYHNSDVPFVRVEFTKGVDWLVIIGSVMAASAVTTAGLLGYGVYKLSEQFPWVVPVTLLGVGMFFLRRAMIKQAG